jgi:hypothetical protein
MRRANLDRNRALTVRGGDESKSARGNNFQIHPELTHVTGIDRTGHGLFPSLGAARCHFGIRQLSLTNRNVRTTETT